MPTLKSIQLISSSNASEENTTDGQFELTFLLDVDSTLEEEDSADDFSFDLELVSTGGTATFGQDYYLVFEEGTGEKYLTNVGSSISLNDILFFPTSENVYRGILKLLVRPIDDSIIETDETIDLELKLTVENSNDQQDSINYSGNDILNIEDFQLTPSISTYTPVIYETAVDFGDAVSLDGVNDYVEVSANQNPTNAITVEAWAKSDTTTWNSTGSLVSKRNAFILHPQENSRDIRFYIHNGSQWYSLTYTPDSSFDITQWHHYAGTYDGVTLRFYVDGQEVSTSEINAGAINLDNDVLTIGRDDGLNRYFDGQIDEVRIWETARTQEDIQENLYQKLDGTENGLVAYYNFDEDSVDGNTIADITENGNNGTLTNGNGDNFDPSLSFKGYVDIELNNKVTNQPGIILNYQIESDSTANQDEDYYNSQTDVSTTDGEPQTDVSTTDRKEPQTDSIFIAEGEDSGRIYLTALPDAVVEGDENIKLTLLPDFNKALDLDGVDDYVTLQPASQLELTNSSFTVEAWINIDNFSSSDLSILGTDQTSLNQGLHLVIRNQKPYMGFYGNDTGGNTTLETGTWYHITWRYDADAQEQAIFINGQLDVSNTGKAAFNGTGNVHIGRWRSGEYFDGQIDEVRIWNTARTEDEIQDTLYATLNGNEEPNLVAYYNFNDDSVDGTTIYDISENTNNGSLINNKSLLLNGSNDYIQIANSDGGFVDFGTSKFSMELWFKTNDNEGFLIGSGSNTSGDFWQVYIEDGKAKFNFDTGQNTNEAASSDNAVNDGQWHHLVAIRDGNQSGKLYLDGKEVGSLSLTKNSSIQGHSDVYIGKYGVGDNNYFAGEIDEIKIWNYALSAREVETNYSTASFYETDSNLKAYYTFDDSNANDLSSSNNGTVNGGSFVGSGIFSEQNFTNSLVYDPFATNGPTYIIETSQSAEITIQDSDNYVVDIAVANEFGDDLSDGTNFVVVDQNGNATFQVKLTSEPTEEDVTVTISVNGTDNDLDFTSSNWDSYQSFSASNISTDSDISLTISGGNYSSQTKQLSVSAVNDDDVTILKLTEGGSELELTPTVSINATTNATEGNEKESGVFTISLDTPAPDGGLVIPISVSSTATEGTDYNLYADSFTYSGENALSFDGVDDYVEVSTSQNPTDAITVEAWAKSDTTTWNSTGSLVSKRNAFILHPQENSRDIRFYIHNGSQWYSLTYTPDSSFDITQWHHYAGTYDGVTLRFYVNGKEVSTSEINAGAINLDNSVLTIGRDDGFSDRYFDGQIDEVRIWNAARSETEIQENLYQKLSGTEEGLVAYYNFDNATTIVPDVTENGNDATTYIGQSLSFDGVDDYVTLQPASQLELTNSSFTVEAWINIDNFSSSDLSILGTDQTSLNQGLHLVIRNQKPYMGFYANDTGGNTTLETGTWYHIAWRYDANAQEQAIFLNGQLDNSNTGKAAFNGTGNVHIGRWRSGGYFDGQIDEVRIWNTARSSEEIQENLYKKLEGTEDGLTAYYNFDSDVDTTINDSTDNGFDGSLSNGDSSNLTTSNIGYTLNDWEVTKTPVVKIAEGETQATITVSKIDNETVEGADETVTVTLEDWPNYEVDNNKQSATVTLNNDDEAGIEFAKLTTSNDTVVATSLEYYNNTLVTSEVATIELEVTSDYANGNLGLKIASGSDSYTLTAGTELSFSDGAVVTVDTDTTISTDDVGTSVAVTFTADSGNLAITTDETADIELSGEDSTTFAVRLSSQPNDTVTLDLAVGDTTEGAFASSASSQSLTFTTDNWDTYQEVTVYGVDDSEDDDNVEYNISVTASSNDSNYNQITDSIAVNNLDNDEPIEEVDDTSNSSDIIASLGFVNNNGEITEGSTGQLQITLSEAAPVGGLKVRYAVSGGTATPDEDFVDLQGFVERAYDSDENPLSQAHIGVFSLEEALGDFKLVDLDSDGDLDAVLIRDSTIHYYRNNSSSSFSEFEELTGTDNPFDSISGESIAFGDLNGDTKPDVLLLSGDGNISYYENTTQNASSTPSFTLNSTVISNSNINQITLVNIDADANGYLELFAGLDDGTISYYEQTNTTPTFVENSNANPLSSFSSIDGNGVEVVPNFVDYDSDGDVDVFIGMSGGVTYYENTGDANNPSFIERTGSDNPFASISNELSHPYLADIDNDGDVDAFVAYESFDPQIQIGYYENTFFQEVEIAEGATTATIDITTIADKIAEDDETIEVSLSAKPSQSYTLKVTRGWIDGAFELGTIELQITDSDTEVVGLPSGTELTFEDDNGNQVVFTVYDSVSVFNQTPTIVNGTVESNSDTSIIAVDETTDFTDEGYRLVEGDTTPFTSTVSIIDDDVAGITISGDTDGTTALNTSEADAGDNTQDKTFNIVLDTKPADGKNVAVYLGVENSEEGLLSDGDETNENLVKLVFNSGNWDTSQQVTLSSVDDDIDDGDFSYNIITTVVSHDIFYHEDSVPLIVENDFDASTDTSISLSIDDLSIEELEISAGTQLTFTNGTILEVANSISLSNSEAKNVNVTLIQGESISSTEIAYFQESISPDIAVTNTDNDTAAVIVDKYDISSEEGYSNNYFNVKLATKPVGEVNVTMNPVDANRDKDYNISLDDEFDGESYTVTFDETNWDLAKAVKVTAVDDYDIEYNHTSYVDFKVSSNEDSAYNAVTPPDDVIIKIEDNDLPNASIQAVAAATEAGSPGYFVVTLDNPAPNGFDGTGIVVNYSVSGTVDVDGTGETDDLKPLTGSVRIAPGESRSPIIAFPIDDFKAEGVDLVVTETDTTNEQVSLQINVDSFTASNYSSSSETVELQLVNSDSTETDRITTILSQGTILNFANGAIAKVKDSAIISSDEATNVAITLDSGTISSNETVYQEITLPQGTKLSFENGTVVEVNASTPVSNQQGTAVSVNVVEGDITNISTSDVTNLQGESVTVSLDTGTEYTISDSSSASSASLILQDNDKPGIRIVEIGDTTVVNENGTAEFYISLLSQPEADVTISLAGLPTEQQLEVTNVDTTNNTITLKLADTNVDSLWLKDGEEITFNGQTFTVNGSEGYFIDSEGVSVTVDENVNSLSNGSLLTYSYTELDFQDTYTFNSDNWYKLQTVTVKGIDDNVAETGDFHSSTVGYTISSTDTNYNGFEVAPQTINIIDRTFDAENTAESLIEGFFALQDGLDSVSLPIIGNLDGVAPSFIEDFIGDLVDEIKQTEYVTAQSLQDTFNNVLSGRFGTVEVEITDLSATNIEFLVGIKDSLSESISLNGDLGLPALGIGIESDGSLDANFNYDIDLAFGINTDDGFYLNTEDTGFEVTTDFGLSDNFTATGNLSFLQLDVENGDNVGGTGIDAEFVISLEDNDDSNGDSSQLTLSELNDLRKSDNLFDSIKYGFSGDAALDLDVTTSVEGNTGFPSFSFNLSSELPLFNYSNSDDEEEVSDAILTVSNGLTSTEGSSIILNVTSNDDTNIIQLNKGTELKFGENSVILTKTAYIQTGNIPTTINVKVADDGDNKQTESVTIASGAEAELVSGDFNISFNEITLDLGGFVTDLMSPIINYVNDLIEPFEPIIDVLQTEIKLLDTLDLVDTFDENGDGSATLIEVASTLASTFSGNDLKYEKFFSAVTGIIDLVETLEDLESSISSGENLSVDFGDYTLENFKAASDEEDEDASNYDTKNNGTSKLNSNTKNQAKTSGSGDLGTKISNFFSKLDDLGISIPLIEDPFTAINLFLGQDIDLVTYDIPELDINFEIEQEFPIFGSIKGLLEGGFSIYSDLLVGFDTYGISQWEEEDFDLKDSYLILDGFYLSDVDPDTGEDVDELTLDATIAAGLSASAVVAKAEVKGGITGTASLDIIDGGEFTGTSDGKLRGSEVLEADSLFDLFTLSGSLEAFIKAVVKVGVDLGFYEVMKTVWKEKFSVTLFEFELGSTSGTVSQSYIEDATVFFDANLNGIFEEGEPVTTSNADGSYNLDVPLLFFDTNDNGQIDPEEGRIVTNGGIDTSSGVAVETPLIAPFGAKMVTPLTTIKQKLIEYGVIPEEAEQLIKEALDLPDIKLEEFDPLLAMSKGDERGTKVYKAHVQIQSLFAQTSEFMKGFDGEELEDKRRPIPEQAIDAIAKVIRDSKGKPPIDLSNSAEIKELIKEPLEGKFKPKSGEEAERLPKLLDSLVETIAFGNKEIEEVFKGVLPQDILGKVAPIKKITQDKLPKELRKLVGGARNEDIRELLERVPDTEELISENQNLLPIVDSQDDTTILPRKPKKLAKGQGLRNLLELEGDDLTDTKIKFSLSSKNLTPERIHEIAIFTTEDVEGTINGLSPDSEGYKQAVINKARSIFSILPDDFIPNPKRIMKGFANENIGFLLIQNGTLDSVIRGKTSLDNILLGTETQGNAFRAIQMSEIGENSFRLSFEDELSDADFTDIVIDAELTDETPQIGTDTQGESEGEMLDLRNYTGKQIKIEAPIVREESAYENVVGFYVVEDETGAVSDPLTGNLLNPGDEGYIKAALRNSQNNAFQMGENGLSGSMEIAGGQILAPFIIADGTLEQVVDENPNNDPEVYFAYMSANTDGVDHIRNLGDNTWGFEDLAFGGDGDFNDIVVQLNTTVI